MKHNQQSVCRYNPPLNNTIKYKKIKSKASKLKIKGIKIYKIPPSNKEWTQYFSESRKTWQMKIHQRQKLKNNLGVNPEIWTCIIFGPNQVQIGHLSHKEKFLRNSISFVFGLGNKSSHHINNTVTIWQ